MNRNGWILVAMLSAHGIAQAQSPRGKAEITLNGVTMTIDYGRPSLAGRDMLSQAPAGTVWRLGADAATTLAVSGSAVFGNMVAAKGEYSLFCERVADNRWSLIVNSQTGQWGTEHDRSKDLLGIPLKWEQQEASTERLEIELTQETTDTGILAIRWGHDVLRQRFRLIPDK